MQLSLEETEFYQQLRANHIIMIAASQFKSSCFSWLAQAIDSTASAGTKQLHLRIEQDVNLIHAHGLPPGLLFCEKKALGSKLVQGFQGTWTDKQKICVAQFILKSNLVGIFKQLGKRANLQVRQLSLLGVTSSRIENQLIGTHSQDVPNILMLLLCGLHSAIIQASLQGCRWLTTHNLGINFLVKHRLCGTGTSEAPHQ